MKITAKVTARGFYKGKPTVVEVIEYDGGEDENGDRKKGILDFVENGVSFKKMRYAEINDLTEEDWDLFDHIDFLRDLARKRYLKLRNATHVYNPLPCTIEAYWLAFNHGDGFDEVSEITVEGKIDTFGSPFSDEDTSGVVF